MNQAEYRKIAISAARGKARKQEINPVEMSADDALAILDELYQIDEQLIASVWYGQASDNQIKQFKREWEAWRKEQGHAVDGRR